MRRSFAVAAVGFIGAMAALATPAQAQSPTTLRVGWCTKVVSSAAAPHAIAIKMGWYEQGGVKVEMLPTGGGSECVKLVATGDYQMALSALEPVAIMRQQDVKMRVFYTAYQVFAFRLAVLPDSPVKTIADLRGKKIGVNSMGSSGVFVARALVAELGMDPDKDVSIVVAGEGAQAAAMIRGKQVDAYTSFDTQFALAEAAGVNLRMLPSPSIEKLVGGGIYATEASIAGRRKELIALGQGFAKGTVFALANPEAAVRLTWEVWPQTKPTGKDEATALADEIKVLNSRASSWRIESVGAKRYGEGIEANYELLNAWLLQQKLLKGPVPGKEMFTNELIDEINKFDVAEVQKQAREWKGK